MQSERGVGPKGQLWTGRVLSWLFAAFMLMDAVAHMARPAPVVDAFAKLDLPINLSVGLGVLVLVYVALYVVARTAVLGAVLLTGYLGGAVAIHLRAADGTFPLLFPVVLGIVMWAGLLLRQPRLQRCF